MVVVNMAISSATAQRRQGSLKTKELLKDTATGYISIQTICLSCGLISIGHGLSFTCFGWVLKGLLVFGAAERITLPLELFDIKIGLV